MDYRNKLAFTFVLCSVILAVSGQVGKCPYGWVYRSNSDDCYKFVMTNGGVLSYSLAVDACKRQGGNLASVKDTNERAFIQTQIARFNLASSDRLIWIGLDRNNDAKKWKWTDGSGDDETIGSLGSGTLLYWNSGEPSTGDCIINNYQSGTYMYVGTRDCSKNYRYICKRKTSVPNPCDGENQWESHEGRCYKIFTPAVDKTWGESKALCEAENAQLPVVLDEAANRIVTDMVSGLPGTNHWLGLKTVKTTTAKGYKWVWVNGSDMTYTSWNTEPTVPKGSEDNMCIRTAGNQLTNLWRGVACDSTSSNFICVKNEGKCAPGWYQYLDRCFLFDTERISWDAANDFCSRRGATIAEIKEQGVQDFFKDYLSDFLNNGVDRIWVGMYQQTESAKLTWMSGKEVAAGYTNWAPNEPKPWTGRTAGRIIASAGANQGKWELNNPVEMSGYICEIPQSKYPWDPTTTRPDQTCDPGWLLFNKNCYLLNSSSTDWLQGRQSCRAYVGSDLVDIRTAAEQEFIQRNMVIRDYWIGLHVRENAQRIWKWNDDTAPADYFNWNDGEPNNYDGKENCVEMYAGGKWNDNQCSLKIGHICKKPANMNGSPPTVGSTTAETPDWDQKCGVNWFTDPLSDNCYLFNMVTLTWDDALHECKFYGGDLLSVTSDKEKSFIAGRMQPIVDKAGGTVLGFWMGLNDLAWKKRFVWTDKSPVSYVNWASGEPNDYEGRENCGLVYPKTLMWNDEDCSRRFPSICKKRANVQVTTPPLTTITVPPGWFRGCIPGYKGYNNMCYKVFETAMSWSDAQQECRKDKGDLVSIMDADENTFVNDLQGTRAPVWIGFYDNIPKERTMNFVWSDMSPIKYENWYTGEPNNWNINEDCVEMYPQGGYGPYWNDNDCTEKRMFVCKNREVSLQSTVPTGPPPGCPDGFTDMFDGACYLHMKAGAGNNGPWTWPTARTECKKFGVNVDSVWILKNTEQSHLNLKMHEIQGNDGGYWLGLYKPYMSYPYYYWIGGRTWLSSMSFVNWAPNANLRQTCAFMLSNSSSTGLWSTRDCQDKMDNIICKQNQIFTTTPTPTTVYDPQWCAGGWVESDETCYKAFSSLFISQRKTFDEARAHCNSLGGDLASIHTPNTTDALADMIRQRRGNYWIGLNRRDPTKGHVWIDGTSANYFNWKDGQPNNLNNQQNCVLLDSADMRWYDENCYTAYNWVCETPKGKYPSGTTPEPATTPDIPDCGGDWKYHNESCYLLYNRLYDWYDARTYCREQGAELASIASQDENDFLLRMTGKSYLGSVWIGLNELGQNVGYQWSDGSPVSFTNWNLGEPNNAGGAEHCVALYGATGLWNDDQCATRFAVMCKRNNGTQQSPTPATPMPGNCPTNYYTVGNKCFRVYGSNATVTTWTQAQAMCTALGGGIENKKSYLASIANEYEQAALVSLIKDVENDLWIGMHTRSSISRSYVWIDNAKVTYTNWNHGEPNGNWLNNENCVEMYASKFNKYRAGSWNDIKCDINRGYICMQYKDPEIRTTWPGPVKPLCPNGWVAFESNCYKYFGDAKTWGDALSTCQSFSQGQGVEAGLVSLADNYEQNYVHFITETATKNSTWLGLSDAVVRGSFEWSNNWPVTYTNWGINQPKQTDLVSCTSMNNKGLWETEECHVMRPYVCGIRYGIKPTVEPDMLGTCPTSDFFAKGKFCYLISDATIYSNRKTFAEARLECQRWGGDVASIASEGEQNALAAFITQKTQADRVRTNYWLGMTRQFQTGFQWTDGTPLNYVHWAVNEPSDSDGSKGENCVEMYYTGFRWNDITCGKSQAYVCKVAKQLASTRSVPSTPPLTSTTPDSRVTTTSRFTTRSTSTQPPPVTPGGNVGAMTDGNKIGLGVGAAVAIIVVIALVGAAVFFFKRRSNKFIAGDGFENAVYNRGTDSVNLDQPRVAHIDINLDSGIENPTYSTTSDS